MRFETRPLGHWTDPETAVREGSGRFRADWNATLKLLGYEADQLGASLVVIQIDIEEGDLRRDGEDAAGLTPGTLSSPSLPLG